MRISANAKRIIYRVKKIFGRNKKNRILKSLKLPVDTSDVLLIYLLEKKIRFNNKKWVKKKALNQIISNNVWIYWFFIKQIFIFKQSQGRKIWAKGNFHNNRATDYSKGSKSIVTLNETCFLCKQPHQIFQCKTFIELPTQSKRDEIRKANLCWNCLRHGHGVQNCTS